MNILLLRIHSAKKLLFHSTPLRTKKRQEILLLLYWKNKKNLFRILVAPILLFPTTKNIKKVVFNDVINFE